MVCGKSGSFAMFDAMRRASSRRSATDHGARSDLERETTFTICATSAFAGSLLSRPIRRSVILNQFVQTARSGCVGRVRGKLNFKVKTCLINEIPQLVMDLTGSGSFL